MVQRRRLKMDPLTRVFVSAVVVSTVGVILVILGSLIYNRVLKRIRKNDLEKRFAAWGLDHRLQVDDGKDLSIILKVVGEKNFHQVIMPLFEGKKLPSPPKGYERQMTMEEATEQHRQEMEQRLKE
jgi:hypothetical protein